MQTTQQKDGKLLKYLDSYLFLKIISYLELSDINILYQSKPSIFSFTDINIWERIVKIKKLQYFLISQPVVNYDEQVNQISTNCSIQPAEEQIININFNDSNDIEQYFAPLVMNINALNEINSSTQNWRKIYQQFNKKVVYSGSYIGDYESHGTEKLKAIQLGYFVFFIKMTGDPNVPAGKITFYMNLSEDLKKGIGRIHLAAADYQSPRWGASCIKIKQHSIDQDNLQKIPFEQIKVDWFIKSEIMVTFTQRLRFAIWKEGTDRFQIKRKQKFLNITYRDIDFSRLFSFSSSLTSDEFFSETE